MSNNEIVDFTTVDGVNVKDMNDGAIFNRIGGLKKDLKELGEIGINGAAMSVAKADINDKITRLTTIVNGRHEEGEES